MAFTKSNIYMLIMLVNLQPPNRRMIAVRFSRIEKEGYNAFNLLIWLTDFMGYIDGPALR
jgi:hypothetical protein